MALSFLIYIYLIWEAQFKYTVLFTAYKGKDLPN